MTTILYSAIYGGYDRPKSQPLVDVRKVLLTDRPMEVDGWEVRVEPLVNLPIPMMAAKWWKCRPDLAVPEADVAIWIDGSMTVTQPDFVAEMEAAVEGVDAAFLRHPWRDCIYEELDASMSEPKYAGQPMAAQVEHYRKEGHPAHAGLVATGCMVRRNTPGSQEFGNAWWAENVRWSFQDQLSLPFVWRLPGFDWCYTPDRPWQHWWTIDPHEVSYA